MSGQRIFGTDGVRGLANETLTAELALDLSVAAAHILAEIGVFAGHRPFAVVGRDTRASGEFLEAAVVAGLASAGVDVVRLGVLPTPGVAHLTGSLGADLGVVISASHNPMPDNGIKFLARGGVKLDDAVEQAIEARLREPWQRPTGTAVGRVRDESALSSRYVDHLVSTVGQSLSGVRVVVDCANGAAFDVAPRALRGAGAEVVAICADPDGLNINAGCGSTDLELLRATVLDHGADVGIALDGDADRCLAVDASGTSVDGDQILALLALGLRERGSLAGETVVTTVMTNLGFVHAMKEAGIDVRQTKVGDRYVLEEMKVGEYCLGGEQSGHVIMSQFATTGDGILTALQVLDRMKATGRSLADLSSVVTRLPQVLINVENVDKDRALFDDHVKGAVFKAEARLGDSGRVLLRPSGTEPVVRVMVEAGSTEEAQGIAEELASVVRTRLSLG